MSRFADFSKLLLFVDHFFTALHNITSIYHFDHVKCMFDLLICDLIVVVLISIFIFIFFVHAKCILLTNSSSTHNDIDFSI